MAIYSRSSIQNFDNWWFWLLNLIKEQDDIDKTILCAKDLTEPKYEFLIKKRKDVRIKFLMMQMHLLGVQIEWIKFIRILMTTIQAEKDKF